MSYPLELQIEGNDRLIDLRLAFLESKLLDLYDGVGMSVCHSQDGTPVKVVIDFQTVDDKLHYMLSWHNVFESIDHHHYQID